MSNTSGKSLYTERAVGAALTHLRLRLRVKQNRKTGKRLRHFLETTYKPEAGSGSALAVQNRGYDVQPFRISLSAANFVTAA
jgi:hypothetical protein